MSVELTAPQLDTAAEHLMAAKMFSLASCVMLFYDMTITFGDEVEKIWKQRFTGATVLWFLNRYLSPLGYIVIIVSFHDPWRESICNHYVLYPEILKIFTAFVVGVIFILRLYSIYSRSFPILVTFSLLLVAEIAVKIWAFTDGTQLVLPPELIGCILVGKSASGKRFVYTWVAELVFDTLVFIATLYRTINLYRTSDFGAAHSLVRVIMRDGIMYFAAIFVSNVVTVTLFLTATADLKAVTASFSTLLMVSRLMLNLRREAMRRKPVMPYQFSANSGLPSIHMGADSQPSATYSSMYTISDAERTFEASIVGNLGAPISQWYDEEQIEENDRPVERHDGMDNMEMRLRAQGRIAVEITEEVVIDVDDSIQVTPREHALEHFPR
ncbi:unnamed protein product [Somion occarium]|uniref:DUF6533 domain-containing protein n=1 Tax=Somion occarium TaxID=3059160 RepID=A0ABP1DQG1_9APHY